MYLQGIAEVFLYVMIGAFIVGAVIVGLVWFIVDDNSIKSDVPIEPKIELYINDVWEVDTLYIYKK